MNVICLKTQTCVLEALPALTQYRNISCSKSSDRSSLGKLFTVLWMFCFHPSWFVPMQPSLIPPSDFKPNIHKYITTMWQNTWDESPLNKLYEIAPVVNEPCTHHLNTRRDQSVFNRCRIGHSRLTHEFLLKGEPPPSRMHPT